MEGQNKITEFINNSLLKGFPRIILLRGPKGCGKNLLIKEISSHLGLSFIDITENIDYEYINNIYIKATPTLYIINLDDLTSNKQNILLKLIEEPLNNCYIILKSTANNIIDTILNRSYIINFEPYTKEYLDQFLDPNIQNNRDIILVAYDTPGLLKEFNIKNFEQLYSLCFKIIDKMKQASFSNSLKIIDKLNYKNNFDKFDPYIFFRVLHCVIYTKLLENDLDNQKLYNIMYDSIIKYCNLIENNIFNKEFLIANFITNLWIDIKDEGI